MTARGLSGSASTSREIDGTFEPQLIAKHERRFTGFDDKILAMYAGGMTVREIQGYLAEMYAVDVSPDLISRVTGEVMGEITTWQTRPLEPMYPVVVFNALRVKIREDAVVRSKAVYLALGMLADGTRDILGIWIENTEGAKFWMKVFNELKTRGVHERMDYSETRPLPDAVARRRSAGFNSPGLANAVVEQGCLQLFREIFAKISQQSLHGGIANLTDLVVAQRARFHQSARMQRQAIQRGLVGEAEQASIGFCGDGQLDSAVHGDRIRQMRVLRLETSNAREPTEDLVSF